MRRTPGKHGYATVGRDITERLLKDAFKKIQWVDQSLYTIPTHTKMVVPIVCAMGVFKICVESKTIDVLPY